MGANILFFYFFLWLMLSGISDTNANFETLKCIINLRLIMTIQGYYSDESFEHLHPQKDELIGSEYDNCIFKNCDFSSVNLSSVIFTGCSFQACNLSMAKLQKTAFREVTFTDCKLMGLNFTNCNPIGLSFSFDNCVLNHSTFYQCKMRRTKFKDSSLQEVDFTESDINESIFDNCDLLAATFEGSNIENVDFRTAYRFQLKLEKNKVKNAKFSSSGLMGLLSHYPIKIE